MSAPKRFFMNRKPIHGLHMSKLLTKIASHAPTIEAFQIHQVVEIFQTNKARYMRPKYFSLDKLNCSRINNGMKAMKMATVMLVMGQARNNKRPENSDNKSG